MARWYQSKEAKCPFYKGENKRELMCEGLTKGQVHIRQVFRGEGTMTSFRRNRCGEEWKDCPLAKILWEKYK